MTAEPGGRRGPAVVLVGPPGADVPAVATALAELLGRPVVDTDAVVARSAGSSVVEIFVDRGEDAFRELERLAVIEALAADGAVVALGGGAVTDPRTERDLTGHLVVFLDVGIAEAARRLGFNAERPPGLGNPRQQWLRLMEHRRPRYQQVATATVPTDGLAPHDIAVAVAAGITSAEERAMAEVTRLRVGPGAAGEPPVAAGSAGGGYDVLIGHDLPVAVPGLLGGAQRVLVVGSATLPDPAATVAGQLADAGLEVHRFAVPDAEAGKTAAVLEAGWRQLAAAGFTRSDAVVGVGGGAVTDLAGFLAASWLRGVRVVQVATTVVGMVDAAVGGKTGINLPEGKNLVGAFHPPVGVLCDLALLRTLPRADLVAGLGEVIKCGLIDDPRILELVEGDLAGATDWRSPVLRELVERAVAVKARVVTADLTESGLREILNYGHTFGHAVEQVEDYTWRHGDAVALGMVYAAELGVLAGVTPEDVPGRTRDLLARLGLPTGYPAGRWQALHEAMRRDKKTRGSRLRFVVLSAVGKPELLEDPHPTLLEHAYARTTLQARE